MKIKKLTIENIRCIEKLNIENFNRINFILGENAQGKSTVLESVYILSTSKSNRTFKDREYISFDKETGKICADIEREKRNSINLEYIVSQEKKKVFYTDNTRKNRISEAIGELNSVIFSVSDTEMIKGDPGKRRNFLNLEISQIYPLYAEEYAGYKKTLNMRNSILKDIKNNVRPSYDLLDILDLQLASNGAKLCERREKFINRIKENAAELYNFISDRKSEFSVRYSTFLKDENVSFSDYRNAMFSQLKEKRDTDIKTGITNTGPHRDDIETKINGIPIKTFGSGGEIRSAAFALKMSEIDIIREIVGEYPVVLLDDLMSELDINRRKKTIEKAAENSQVFITTTHLDRTETDIMSTNLYTLDKGKLIKN